MAEMKVATDKGTMLQDLHRQLYPYRDGHQVAQLSREARAAFERAIDPEDLIPLPSDTPPPPPGAFGMYAGVWLVENPALEGLEMSLPDAPVSP